MQECHHRLIITIDSGKQKNITRTQEYNHKFITINYYS